MKILEELEETRKAVAELEGAELENDLDTDNVVVKEEEEKPEEVKEEPAEEKQEETKEEAKPEEKSEEKPEVKTEEKLDDAGYARLRRENAALKKRLEEKKEPKEETADGQQEAANKILVEVINTVQEQKAKEEFAILEQSFAQNTPDFEDVSTQYKAALYHANRMKNPRKTHLELLAMTKKDLLIKAGELMNMGLDPIQEMYEEAKALGFKALPKEEAKEEKAPEKEVKPDLAKVAANRARNAGMAGAKGAGGTTLTRESASLLPVHEWAKLPAAEKARLLGGGL